MSIEYSNLGESLVLRDILNIIKEIVENLLRVNSPVTELSLYTPGLGRNYVLALTG